jgi:methyltransferase (TIGR00027 family)
MFRAAHLLWRQPPKIFEDTLALQLSGCESEAVLKAQMDQLEAEVARNTNPDFARTVLRSVEVPLVTRSRYLEDEVDEAIGRGLSQYVILGAGLDSFAYRRPELAKVLDIFEVDHPATQAWKRARLRAAGVELPANLSLVPVDFERDSLIDNLRMSGYRTDAPSLFSWLGVTMYLSTDAIFGTLRAVAALAPGTEIIFEYIVPKDLVDEETQKVLAAAMAAAEARGEPQQSFFEPAQLAEQVRKIGFTEISDFGPDEVEARYFKDRTDGLRRSALNHYMRARVASDPLETALICSASSDNRFPPRLRRRLLRVSERSR